MRLDRLLNNRHITKKTNIPPEVWVEPTAQQLKDISANNVQMAPIEWVETETKKEN